MMPLPPSGPFAFPERRGGFTHKKDAVAVKQLWSRFIHFLYAHVLHANDTPHRIALGVAIGMFVAITPTPGIQMALTLALATLLKANKIVGLPLVWLSNPVTAIPILLPCWHVGRTLVPTSEGNWHVVARRLSDLFVFGERGLVAHLFEKEFWLGLGRFTLEFGLELWVGCLVVGAAFGILTYFVTRWGVTEYRQRRRVRKIYRNVMRSRVRQGKGRGKGSRPRTIARQPAI